MTSLWTDKADKVVDLYHICNLLDDHFLFRFRFRVRFRFRFRPFPLNPLAPTVATRSTSNAVNFPWSTVFVGNTGKQKTGRITTLVFAAVCLHIATYSSCMKRKFDTGHWHI